MILVLSTRRYPGRFINAPSPLGNIYPQQQQSTTDIELREDTTFELREDLSLELRDA